MIKLNELKVSYHFQNTRQGRDERINTITKNNWGQVVREEYYKGAWRCLTDTGLVFIVEESKTIILTYYFATMEVAIGMYHGNVPEFMKKKIRKNATQYKNRYQENIHVQYKR